MKEVKMENKVCIVVIFAMLLAAITSRAEINPENVVGIWLMEEGSGSNLSDGSGNGHDGKIIGDVNWVDGKFGTALEFPGTLSDFVEVPTDSDLEITESITLMAWILTSEQVAADIVGKDDGSDRNYNIHVATSGKLFLNGGGRVAMPGTTPINDGQWHHVCGTWDGDTARIYVDGMEEASMPYGGPIDRSNVPVKIGLRGSGEGVDRIYKGIIDEVAIFNTGLSEEDIQNVMNNGLEQFTPVYPLGNMTTTWGQLKTGR
jgi:hypothetical protein